MKTYQKYKLVDSLKNKPLSDVELSLTREEAAKVNYAYALNGVNKKLVPVE